MSGAFEDRIVRLSWQLTAVLAIALALGVAFVSPLGPLAAGVGLVMFAIGLIAYGAALLKGAQRSRTEFVHVAGLVLLSGVAPAPIRRALLLSAFVQAALAIGAASIRPFTVVAFGVLAPLAGLGLVSLWAAVHGTFEPRDPDRAS